MIHRFMNWLKGSKYEPKTDFFIDENLEDSLQKSIKNRTHVEELLKTRRTGNVLADTWGGRE